MKLSTVITAALLTSATITAPAADLVVVGHGSGGAHAVRVRGGGHDHDRDHRSDRGRGGAAENPAEELRRAASDLHDAVLHAGRHVGGRGPSVGGAVSAVRKFDAISARFSEQVRRGAPIERLNEDLDRARGAWREVGLRIRPLIVMPEVARATRRAESALADADVMLLDMEAAARFGAIRELSGRISDLAASLHAAADHEAHRLPYAIGGHVRRAADRIGNLDWDARALHSRIMRNEITPGAADALDASHRRALASAHCLSPGIRHDLRALGGMIGELRAAVAACPRPAPGPRVFVRG